MKFNKILLLISSAFVLSCTGDFEELNKDPMSVSEVSPTLRLPNMLYKGYQLEAGDYQVSSLLYSALYCQYHANTSTGFKSGNYMFQNKWAERGFWTAYYQYLLKNLREAEGSLAKHPEYSDMHQIMRITTALGTIRLTDTFGDIPYFEAGKGNVQTPYDTQKSIYYDVFKELTEAVDLLKQHRDNQNTFGNEDMLYQGNVEKWIKLANSLRLRAAIRISFIDPEKAKTEGEAALKESLFESNADNANLQTGIYQGGKGHPMVANAYFNEFRASETIINYLKNLSSIEDPRMPLMFGKTKNYIDGISDTAFKGLRNGVASSELSLPENTYINNSTIWGYMWGFTWNDSEKGDQTTIPTGWKVCPLVMMNYAEVCFLKAEASLRGWQGAGDAQTNYETGIKVSMEEMRVFAPQGSYTTESDDTYITTGNVAWNDADNFEKKLEKIITQKWIGIYPNSNEAWAEFRRTGYPQLMPIVQCLESSIDVANGEFIKKLRYVDNEKINNSQNANDESLNGGQGDGVNVRVWWDTARYK